MSKGKFTKLLQDLSALARRNLFSRHVARFMVAIGIGLFVDYVSALAQACQLLTMLYSFLFCPLAMYIYARHGGISLLIYSWTLPSLFVIVFVAIAVTLWMARKSTTHT